MGAPREHKTPSFAAILQALLVVIFTLLLPTIVASLVAAREYFSVNNLQQKALFDDIAGTYIHMQIVGLFALLASVARFLIERNSKNVEWDYQLRQNYISIFVSYIVFALLQSNVFLKILYKNIDSAELKLTFVNLILIGALSGYFAKDVLDLAKKRLRGMVSDE